ncbi:MAG: CobW family GTP-binding protein [Hyphomicrobiaceae bacterium]
MIPVTVLTGFLGGGKTTLLARLLKDPAFGRTAVIVNEFGEAGIDHDLVSASDESVVELETGCLCCAIRGDLEATIADLVARRENCSVPPFERIVIETSGLADPAPVLNAVMSETARGSGAVLANVVTVVDAALGMTTLEREAQSVRQVAVADTLVMTKRDLLAAEPSDLLAKVRKLNPHAPVHWADRGRLDDTSMFSVSAALPAARTANIIARSTGDQGDADGDRPLHGDGIRAHVVSRQRPLPALVLTLFLEALADHCGDNLLRLKGLVHVAEYPDAPAVVHGVQHVFHEPQWLQHWPGDDHATRLVLIGRGHSELWVNQLLDALEAEVAEVQAEAG